MADIIKNYNRIDSVTLVQQMYENDLSKKTIADNPVFNTGLARLLYTDNLRLALKLRSDNGGIFQLVGCKGGMPILKNQETYEYIVSNPIELGGMQSINTCEQFDGFVMKGCTIIEDSLVESVRDAKLNGFRQMALNTINHLSMLATTGTVNILGQDSHVEPMVLDSHLVNLTAPAPLWNVTSTDIRVSMEADIKPQIVAIENGRYANFSNMTVYMSEATFSKTLGVNSVISNTFGVNAFQTINDQMRAYSGTFLGTVVVSNMQTQDENGNLVKMFEDDYIYIKTSTESLLDIYVSESKDPSYQSARLPGLTSPLAQAVGIVEWTNDPRIAGVELAPRRPNETLVYEIGAKMAATALVNPNVKLFKVQVA